MSTERDLGVALSGGGHRATAFGLGVLLALVDQELNQRVESISSVSGGSIANGIVMVGPDFGSVSTPEFERHIGAALAAISDRGILLGGAPATRGYMRRLIAAGLVALVACVVTAVTIVGHWWIVAVIAAAVAVVAGFVASRLFSRRSIHTERAIDSELLGNRSLSLADLRGTPSSVHHVLCTTELQTGTSVYFSNRLVYGYGFSGSTAPVDLRLATAVQASACVPGAFAPRVIPLAQLGLVGATGRIVLVDGGVYDNMADEWEYGFASRKKSWPAVVDAQPGAAALLLVANASGGWDDVKPIKGRGVRLELAGVMRSKDVQYDVSTAHRRRALAALFRDHNDKTPDGAFAQVSASPYDIAEQFGSRAGWASDDRSKRADEVRAFLDSQGYTDAGWTSLVKKTSGVATTLAPLGRETTAALLEHGYVLTLVNMYVLHGLGELRPIDRTRFVRLAAGTTT
jgi:membrane protein implicated in regulation of membrane protease activity